jgi:dihydrofolate synthase/folylpolyglutamate synthase
VTAGLPARSGGSAYHDAVAALADRGRFGVRLGLGRTRALLRALGDPERSLRGALIGGTNGKGSTLALCSAALRAAGLRVGETPKPHLVTYRERLQVDGRPIDPSTFARLVDEVLRAADRVEGRLGPATEFELLTALVFRWFAEAGIDVALVEVGLGGRLDATHAWDGGVATITNVDLDHMDRLGPTVEAIAREKAAIIERGDRAVTGAVGGALAIIRRRAQRMEVPLVIAPPAPLLALDRDGIVVDLPSTGRTRVGLRGRHQAANAAVADATLDALAAAGIATADADARRAGYAAARWPGRLELLAIAVDGHPRDVLLDGAHNPAGAAALASALDDLAPHLPTTGDGPVLLIGAMGDKDVTGIVASLARSPLVQGSHIICTRPDGARALDPVHLASEWAAQLAAPGSGVPRPRVSVVDDPEEALDAALRLGSPVIVAGSLYLVGAVRGRLVHDSDLDDPPQVSGTDAGVDRVEADR